jgi:hypothetical protein
MPSPPTPTPTPTLTPPVANVPPTIRAIRVSTTRAEVDQAVNISADVDDPDATPGSLAYNWSASGRLASDGRTVSNLGTFSGSGASVTWHLAHGTVATPIDVTIALEVVETYTTPDGPAQNHASQATEPFRVHDWDAEVTDMTLTFLLKYFGNSSVSPEACLVDFSDSCPGKEAELGDIIHNRETFVILSAQATISTIDFDASLNFADIYASCRFVSRRRDNGSVETAAGTCHLTGVYEQRRWWLCDSYFDGPQNLPFGMRDFFGIRRR